MVADTWTQGPWKQQGLLNTEVPLKPLFPVSATNFSLWTHFFLSPKFWHVMLHFCSVLRTFKLSFLICSLSQINSMLIIINSVACCLSSMNLYTFCNSYYCTSCIMGFQFFLTCWDLLLCPNMWPILESFS